jgi:hypothetical protein
MKILRRINYCLLCLFAILGIDWAILAITKSVLDSNQRKLLATLIIGAWIPMTLLKLFALDDTLEQNKLQGRPKGD